MYWSWQAWAQDGTEDGDVDDVEVVAVTPTDGPVALTRDAQFTSYFDHARRTELGRSAWLLTGDTHRAQELVQQALVKTYLAWPRARDGEPIAYARRVMANARTESWRRTRREVLGPVEALPDRGEAGGQSVVDDRDQLVRALAGIGARQRKVVVLRYFVGMTEREVAEVLGISTGTVKSQAARALQHLRRELALEATPISGRSGKGDDDAPR